jgi:hypothetical protein
MKRRRVRYSNRKYVNRVLRTFKPRNAVQELDEEMYGVAIGGPPKETGK